MTRIATGTFALLGASLLSACVVAPYAPSPMYRPGPAYGGGAYEADLAVAPAPPPAPYGEVVPIAPFIGALWISGYWGWSGNRHVWVGGHYERGRPGYNWVPHRWEPVSGSWHLRGGHWAPR